ncbi:exo-alpha-sialidase [Neorhodopirellula lusitana]|uniref:exo-alpha-sialidase n=1 Tax=Neorhodopirellula lusitana TaxID=445327 RepID=UPI00384C8794
MTLVRSFAPLAGMLVFATLAFADESSVKLQPLAYNNPGLEVDLGVGLWAYPLPIDYDQDGDMDLLVGCPDKPSNGTYFFENPTQDPSVEMPVFKAGVRIGDGSHFMQLSVVDGESVVMLPAKEFRRDPKSGKFDFSKPTQIDARANPNDHTPGRTRANMWRYVDFDGDGDHDIVVGSGDWTDYSWDHAYDNNGQWRNGPLHGYVYLIVNEGNQDKPVFSSRPERLQAGGSQIDVYGWPSPNFADFDNDGDLDLVCGEFLDGFTYFENLGSRTEPAYASGQKLNNAGGDPLVMHLQMITPTAIDWDADGDIDLIVGDEDGRVALVENTGEIRDHQPVFLAPKYFRQQADTLKFGALATPFAYDWDNDGDEDILCGNTAGSIGYFENLGQSKSGLPTWAAPQLLDVKQRDGTRTPFRVMAGPSGSIQGPAEAKWGYTTLSAADWDGDGDGDIVFNSILARLGMLSNESGTLVEKTFEFGRREAPPKWSWSQTPGTSTLTQWRTTPVAIDFDGDTKLDLVMLDQEGFLTLRSRGGAAERIFIDESGEPLQLNSGTCGRSGRVKLAVVDWDGDTRLDVLVNSENATWYRNCADIDGKVLLKKVGNLAKRNVAGHTSSPAVCDFDKDGKPDLLVGSENGRIYHIAHDDCVTFPADKITPIEPTGAKPPAFPGFVSKSSIFENPPFRECHASTICQTSRGLVASWFGGTREGKPDVAIWSSFHDGLKWSRPQRVAEGVQYEGLRYPCWNPVLYQPPGDAPLLLFFKVGPRPHSWWGEVMVSCDRGRTFTDRKRLPEGIDGPVRCKPILLDDGKTLLCGSSTENEGWRVHFEKINLLDGELSGDWKRIGPISDGQDFSAIQPTILTHPDGRLQALCRTKEQVIASSESNDGGETWSQLTATNLPNPNSGIDAVTLSDGRHLMIYNHLSSAKIEWGKRSVLNLAISNDGVNWREVGVLEKEKTGEFSYPAIIQSDDGLVHMTYTWMRKKIQHVVVDPSQLK